MPRFVRVFSADECERSLDDLQDEVNQWVLENGYEDAEYQFQAFPFSFDGESIIVYSITVTYTAPYPYRNL